MRPQQIAQNFVQSGLESLQGKRLHNLSGQPILDHPPVEKLFFLYSQNLSWFHLLPLKTFTFTIKIKENTTRATMPWVLGAYVEK